jgi:predicted N-acetyltransferase YhbS
MQIRSYDHKGDYERVGQFLLDAFRPTENHLTWLQPRWEYMHFLPWTQELDLTKFGIAERDGQMIGIVHFEANEAEVFIQAHPDHQQVRFAMLDYAEQNGFQGMSQSRNRLFRAVYVNDFDRELEAEVDARGYEKWVDFAQPMSVFNLDEQPVPAPELPEGYRVQSLADENDFHKINRVLWRGFNHEGPPPEEEVEGRRYAQRAPNFRKDLTIVAVAPDGNYASFCGMWYIPQNEVAYLEPLATDPDYRRMGMARAAVYESMRRVKALGARKVYVGSAQEFYLALGFEVKFTAYPWAKILD